MGSHYGRKSKIRLKGRREKKRRKRKILKYESDVYKNHETTSFLSKAHNWKSPESDKVSNYWLQAFPAAYSYITKIFNTITGNHMQMLHCFTPGIMNVYIS